MNDSEQDRSVRYYAVTETIDHEPHEGLYASNGTSVMWLGGWQVEFAEVNIRDFRAGRTIFSKYKAVELLEPGDLRYDHLLSHYGVGQDLFGSPLSIKINDDPIDEINPQDAWQLVLTIAQEEIKDNRPVALSVEGKQINHFFFPEDMTPEAEELVREQIFNLAQHDGVFTLSSVEVSLRLGAYL